MFSEAAASGDGGAASAGEIVAIGAGDRFDDAELAQASKMSGEGSGRALGERRQEVGAAEASDVEGGTLQGRQQGLFGAAEEVETPDSAAFDGAGLGETVERPDAGREVVQTGEVFEVAAVATKQDVKQFTCWLIFCRAARRARQGAVAGERPASRGDERVDRSVHDRPLSRCRRLPTTVQRG